MLAGLHFLLCTILFIYKFVYISICNTQTSINHIYIYVCVFVCARVYIYASLCLCVPTPHACNIKTSFWDLQKFNIFLQWHYIFFPLKLVLIHAFVALGWNTVFNNFIKTNGFTFSKFWHLCGKFHTLYYQQQHSDHLSRPVQNLYLGIVALNRGKTNFLNFVKLYLCLFQRQSYYGQS